MTSHADHQFSPFNGSTAERVSAVKAATARIPLNSFGLPEGIYRPDLLPYFQIPEPDNARQSTDPVAYVDASLEGQIALDLVSPDDVKVQSNQAPFGQPELTTQSTDLPTDGESPTDLALLVHPQEVAKSDISYAWMPLSYAEGFPAVDGGRPFWHQLDFEPDDAFRVFQEYLAIGRTGTRQLFLLPDKLRTSEEPFTVPDNLWSSNELLQDLESCYHLYYWVYRAKAYDVFQTVLRKRQRALDAMSLEDEHFMKATRMVDLWDELLEDEEFLASITPRTALEILKTGIQLQRISKGLPANAPASEATQEGQDASVEVILRSLAGNQVVAETARDEMSDGADLRQLLSDPKTAALAQELVIKVHSQGK